jgi:hypothetical protein
MFPLFALVVKLKDPDRLPRSIAIYNQQTTPKGHLMQQMKCKESLLRNMGNRSASADSNVSVPVIFSLNTVTLGVHDILSPFFDLCKQYLFYHFSVKYFRSIIFGEVISPMSHMMLIPVIPESNPTLVEFWLFLKYHFTFESK